MGHWAASGACIKIGINGPTVFIIENDNITGDILCEHHNDDLEYLLSRIEEVQNLLDLSTEQYDNLYIEVESIKENINRFSDNFDKQNAWCNKCKKFVFAKRKSAYSDYIVCPICKENDIDVISDQVRYFYENIKSLIHGSENKNLVY